MILQCTESFQETDLKFLIETAFFTVEIENKTVHFFSYQTLYSNPTVPTATAKQHQQGAVKREANYWYT